MERFTLLLSFSAIALISSTAQAQNPPNLGSVMLYDYGTDTYSYGWDSETDVPYFFQYSPDLMVWDYLNVIEPGDGQYKEWDFQIDENGHVPTERFFLRLAYPDNPLSDPIDGDSDGDKVGNQDELDQGTDPLLALLGDDRDQLPDDWELFHFGDLDQTSVSNADGDLLDDYHEFLYGTDPNSATTFTSGLDDDSDTVPNEEDASPLDPNIGAVAITISVPANSSVID